MSIIINTVKGHPNDELITTLRRKVSAYASQNRAIFIGWTSGGEDGLGQRFSNKYRPNGFDFIVAIYETSSTKNARDVEAIMIDYGKDHYGTKVRNQIGGGGGAEGDGNKNYVYVAVKR